MTIRIAITGAAGFIGSSLALFLAQQGHVVYACDWANRTGLTPIDNNPESTQARLRAERLDSLAQTPGIELSQLDLATTGAFDAWVAERQPNVVIHLAAQAGVRHSMQAPLDFVASNLVGFAHVLDACRQHGVKRLLYASSSSVYGMRDSAPFLEEDRTDRPESFYAATKQANEAMAMAYHAQYGLQSLGMRFFTVYGPRGRPDMAPFLFAQAIRRQQPITLFAKGELLRDFTYVDDTVAAIAALASASGRWEGATVVNVGHNRPISVNSFVKSLASQLGVEPIITYAPMQKADVKLTCASETRLLSMIGQWPDTPLEKGLSQFVTWLQKWDPLGQPA
jgi:UDP-glucuronate 4-epimerase